MKEFERAPQNNKIIGITNCITEIPQDIKLELVDGTLTLKAGSKVYVPNGFEADGVTPKFDVVVVESDLVYANWGQASDKCLVIYLNGILHRTPTIENNYSGSSQPTAPINQTWWYDTANNVMQQYDGSSWSIMANVALPLAIATFSSGAPTSIDQVFNGFGYIGSTVFALPGVKGLIPNGRNADGSLKNIEFVNDTVKMFTYTYSLRNAPVFFENNKLVSDPYVNYFDNKLEIINPTQYQRAYVRYENQWYSRVGNTSVWKKIQLIPVGFCEKETNVTSLQTKTAFHAVDYNDAALKQNFQVVSTLPSSPQADVFYFIPE